MRNWMRGFAIVSFVASAAIVGTAEMGAAQTAQLCLAGQLRGAGNVCKAVAKCYTVAMKKGGAVDPACVSTHGARLAPIYSELEALSTCLVEGAAGDVVDGFADDVASIASALGLDGGKCAGIKMAALGKECAGYLRCYAAAAASSQDVDPGCLAVHEEKLLKSWNKADAKGCPAVGDRLTLQGIVGDIAASTFSLLRGTGTTTTTVGASTSTVTLP